MRLSVVLPNYNHAERLPRALRALLRQELPPDEIIIVDDASTDDSLHVIEEFLRNHKSIKLIRHDVNRGAPAALNTGLMAATGEFVYFAASDDFVLAGLFATAISALTRCPAAAYFCAQVVLVDRKGTIVDFRPQLPPSIGEAAITPQQTRHLIRTIDNWAVGPSVVHRRTSLIAIGGFNESLGSLCDGMVYRLQALRTGFCFSPRIVAAWEVYAESLSARSALSPTQGKRLVEAAKYNISQTFPAPLDREYQDLFARRFRFNSARLALVASSSEAQTVSDLAGGDNLDQQIISLFGIKTPAARMAIQAWLILRLRPFGFAAMAQAWLRKLLTWRHQRAVATQLIAAESQ